MKLSYLILCLLIGQFSVTAQNETIKIGILPSEYGEGMPEQEFKEFEKNILEYIEKIERYDVVKMPKDFLRGENKRLTTKDSIAIGEAASNVAYLIQIVFGDTEWTTIETGGVPGINRSSSSSAPDGLQSASLWTTLNLYNVSTGVLENSITITAKSDEDSKFRRAPTSVKKNFKAAVSASQKSLWKKVKLGIRKLLPLDIQVQKVVKENKDGAEMVKLNVGGYHGMKVKDRLQIYYEKEYIVRGNPTMRHVKVGEIKVNQLDTKTSLCVVEKGGEAIKELLVKNVTLKCGLIDSDKPTAHYGF